MSCPCALCCPPLSKTHPMEIAPHYDCAPMGRGSELQDDRPFRRERFPWAAREVPEGSLHHPFLSGLRHWRIAVEQYRGDTYGIPFDWRYDTLI